ncbi:uncharacterized protein LOC113497235 [Trichoplusia ni]|uniref:Uncharacterized protein LOC113497235 n=1 Tax=Trichoplusia ni TaxID=7111 RepID=A0A7E5VW44_TRINI|nr:uncharacterized protein LOC113497235 [Trichoplusia ni]
MWFACFLVSVLYVSGQCENIMETRQFDNEHSLVQCVTNILKLYFSEGKLTYVEMESDDDELLKNIYSSSKFSLVSRRSTFQPHLPNQGYLMTSRDVTAFAKHFKYLLMDPMWNPYTRVLIVIRSLSESDLRNAFDVLLNHHVNNVVIVNGTADAHLYAYNPFDNHACGKYYSDIISYGICSQTEMNLYPEKIGARLKNCTFLASLSHRPPFSIDPARTEGENLLGTEAYIFKVLMEKEQINFIMNYNYNGDIFSTVAPNMTAIGPMNMLQNNETHVIVGGMMMVAARAAAFSYLGGYHDYNNEIRIIVKTASLIPIWKSVYIEFDITVWMLLFLTLIVYTMILIYVFRDMDKGQLILDLLDNLLSHGRHIRSRTLVKCLLLVWIWFAYLINTFYQSSLVSLTTDPSKEYQVADDKDLVEYRYEPCFSLALRNFLMSESVTNGSSFPPQRKGCHTTAEAMQTITKTKGFYTMVPNYVYLYNMKSFNNKWGESLIYPFEKPYARFLFCFYFYKGFPISKSLRLNARRMRESGLADKSLSDLYFKRSLKQRFSQKQFEVRFSLPWRVYVIGCAISAITFILELVPKNVWPKCRIQLQS